MMNIELKETECGILDRGRFEDMTMDDAKSRELALKLELLYSEWPQGKRMMADVVVALKGRSLTVDKVGLENQQIRVLIPLPDDFIVVPESARTRIFELMSAVFDDYMGDNGRALLERYTRQSASDATWIMINADLAKYEGEREAADEGQLWRCVSKWFGLEPMLRVHVAINN